jgi:hypothetical protein
LNRKLICITNLKGTHISHNSRYIPIRMNKPLTLPRLLINRHLKYLDCHISTQFCFGGQNAETFNINREETSRYYSDLRVKYKLNYCVTLTSHTIM